MKERKFVLPVGLSGEVVLRIVCQNCLAHFDCSPNSEQNYHADIIHGNLAGIEDRCLLVEGSARGPVYLFFYDFESLSLQEQVPASGAKIPKVKDRLTLACLSCLRCLVVSCCQPEFSENEGLLSVKGECITSEKCCLKNKVNG
ncbi:MAG: hypothetical protein N2558_03595 [Patescibacteria group bacterium]|nr:hypothetical protein [Patescibacteria group bacterium]